jgi:hypothetical protein
VLIKTPKDSSHLKRLGIEVSSLNSQVVADERKLKMMKRE